MPAPQPSPRTCPAATARRRPPRRSGGSWSAAGSSPPQPQKRPKSSLIRFEADQPNQRWRADTTHWQLADGTDVEVLNIIDDHSRLAVASHARRVFKAADAVDVFDTAFCRWGYPQRSD